LSSFVLEPHACEMPTIPPHEAKAQATHWPPRGPARVLVLLDRPVLIELIKLTLNHGVYTTRAVMTVDEFASSLITWQPHLAIIDMDLNGAQVLALLGAKPVGGVRLPVIGLTQRGDLKSKWLPSRLAWTTS
jgi:DNA-binding NtrC family response regulator